ncbi:MAG: monooxygenase [Rhizobiales bacterium]|nr:monooxygenase [Hyphomicrobiales bacterium]
MHIAIIGAGPAGLYSAYLIKRAIADARVEVHERLPRGTTFGFGIVFSDRALDFLVADDPGTHAALVPALERWSDLTLVHQGERVVIDGIGFAAIGRQRFLDLLEARALEVGVEVNYADPADELPYCDLVIGADGVNSLVRQRHGDALGTSETHLSNRFIWFGTARPFDTLTQTFVRTRHGAFNAHHYRYAPDASTFIVETNEATWRDAGLGAMSETDSLSYCQEVFADALGGEALISNNSCWRQFPVIRNRAWSHGNAVLLGDALHTAHFSIGSGTRLALEDAIALAGAIKAQPDDLTAALEDYQSGRAPVLDKLLKAADKSALWYENFAEHMKLEPYEFAMSYINRTGRIDPDRLKALSPGFVARYEGTAA